MKSLILLVAVLFVCPLSAQPKLSMTGTVFDMKGKTKLFNYNRYETSVGSVRKIKSDFKNLKGQVAVEEEIQIKMGQVVRYTIDHRQTGEKGSINIREGRVYFTKTDAQGKVSESDESYPENFILGMTLVSHLQQNWKSLLKGDSLRTRFGVWSRTETVGFKFWKDDEIKKDGKDLVVIVMKPTSFIIRSSVDPLYLTFEKTNMNLVSIKGRTLPKRKKGDKWKDLDALIQYKVL